MNRKNSEKHIWFLVLRALLVTVLALLALACLCHFDVIHVSSSVPAAYIADLIF